MADDDTTEENRQFEQVLNRLDALMKRSHASEAVDESEVCVPVLTEIYLGAALSPYAVAGLEAPPLLTEFVSLPQLAVEAPAAAGLVPEPELPAQPLLSREQEVESMVAELMPRLREMIALIVQEEIHSAQQNLASRIGQEAEQALRLHLLQKSEPGIGSKPK